MNVGRSEQIRKAKLYSIIGLYYDDGDDENPFSKIFLLEFSIELKHEAYKLNVRVI